MSLSQILDTFGDLSEWLADACRAEDALALSLASTSWLEALSRPGIWSRYLQGSQDALARPILADPAAAAVFAAVHPANLRAVVAALRAPGWLRRYPGMRRRLAAGCLVGRMLPRKSRARLSKAQALRDVRCKLAQNALHCRKSPADLKLRKRTQAQQAVDRAHAEKVLAFHGPPVPKGAASQAEEGLSAPVTPKRQGRDLKRNASGEKESPPKSARSKLVETPVVSASKKTASPASCSASAVGCEAPSSLSSSSSASSSSPSASSSGVKSSSSLRLQQDISKAPVRTYEGELHEGKPHGHGICKWSSGRSYEGQFEAGKMHGKGKLSARDGRTYDGDFVRGRPEGVGTLCEVDGTVYKGEFAQGQRQGYGIQKFQDGRVYAGQFTAGQPHGRGILRSQAGALMFQGLFEEGRVSRPLDRADMNGAGVTL